MEPSSSFFIQNMISETNKSKLLQIANRLPIIEKIVDRLPGWKADLLTKPAEIFWSNLYSLPC